MPKDIEMTERADLIKEIDNLPHKYFGEVLDFVGYLRQKDADKSNDTANKFLARVVVVPLTGNIPGVSW